MSSEEYKKQIIKMLSQIKDTDFLRRIYLILVVALQGRS